ncbi:MAG: DegV family protein [Clostridiales bacterium]|nr:DegV family protein [Clostridiales bacterium]
MKKFQILVDSASDLSNSYLQGEDIPFKVIPLTILANNKEYIDDDNIDIDAMLTDMHKCKKNTSACPAPQSFLQEFENAEYTFIVTITSKLSGCYNAAVVAKNSHSKPENIFVVDSKATCGTEILIIDKLVKLIKEGLSYEEICEKIVAYRDKKSLFFILQKFDNLINNGRMSKIAGLIASTLVIRPICIAKEGEIAMLKKVIGIKNAFSKLIQLIKDRFHEEPENREKLIITHCKNEQDANYLKDEIAKVCDFKEIEVRPMKGLCSFYALEKGLILCH